MKNLRLGTLAAASVLLALAVAGCGGANEAPAGAAAAPAEATPPPPQPVPLVGTVRWQVAGEGTTTGAGTAGKASVDGAGYLSVIVEKAPVAAGDMVTVKGNLTAPAGRVAEPRR